MIKHNQPFLNSADKKIIRMVMDSNYLAAGKRGAEFEKSFAGYLNAKGGEACVVSSGTSALFLALYALEIKPKDEIILPTYVCSAVLNAIAMSRAVPVLVDINLEDFNISFAKTKQAMTAKTKAVIVPHIYGVPADLGQFKKLGVAIIEDCAQAVGAEYKGKKVGTIGDIAAFSFYATKLLTTGYGGMVYSRNRKYIDKIKDYVDFDYRRNYYPRFNFQIGDMQAALGSSQLAKLDYFLKRREEIAKRYISDLTMKSLRFQEMCTQDKRVYYRFVVRINNPHKLINFMKKFKIQTIVPIEDWELLHRYLKLPRGNFPIAEEIARSTVSLPVYPALKDKEVDYIIKTMIKGLNYVK